MGLTPSTFYKKDKKLKYSNENFADILNNKKYDSIEATHIPFPNDHLLAQFSKLAYKDTFDELPAGWEVLTTAKNSSVYNGYFGVSFWNPKFCQIIVAHRGTVKTNPGALYTDVKLSIGYAETNQVKSAATFVHEVGDAIKTKMNSEGMRYQLSITGHSLGAWLAQMTTYTLKYLTLCNDKFESDCNYRENIHAHTVVFESPGCRENMNELSNQYVPFHMKRRFGNYYSLDMTVYLSEVNPINSVNEQVGFVYKVPCTTHKMNDILLLFDTEGKIKRELILRSQSGFYASIKAFLKPITKIDFETKSENLNQHSLNVFNENEEDFIRDWIYLRDYQSACFRNVQNELPHFEIDFENNFIKSDDVITTIASIKNYKISKTFMSDNLSIYHTNVANVMFNIRTEQFKKSLIYLNDGYYINDEKYRLKNFLESDTPILYISIKSAEYRLETSIINNVFTFYKNTDSNFTYKYSIINWILLLPILTENTLLFQDLDIDLLILECFDLNKEDIETINKILEIATFKVVILSIDTFLFTNSKFVRKVTGFSGTVKFQDLEIGTQRKLLEQEKVIINNKRISIQSLFHITVNNEELNDALLSNLLLQILTTSDIVCSELNTTYHDILNGITIEMHEQIDENKRSLGFCRSIDFERECLNSLKTHSNKTIYLFKEIHNTLFLSKIFRSDLYIQRNITRVKFLKPSIFEDRNTHQTFYVCGNQTLFSEMSSNSDPDRYIFLTEENARLKLQRTKRWAHILKINDDKTIRLLGSKGNVQVLKQYVANEGVLESELMDDNVIILSGDTGVGKSSVIKMLYLRFQETHWIFVVQLVHANFENIDFKDNILTDCAKFILSTCGMDDEYLMFLLSFSFRHATSMPIYLLFDGFEQILNIESKQKFMKMINVLKYSSSVNIFITTRTYACEELENGIGILASNFLPTEIEITTYLTNFWKLQLEILENNFDPESLQNRAKFVLNTALQFFGENISTFLGLPLHVRIMAEIAAPNNSPLNSTSVFADILYAYEKLIETYSDTYFRRCEFPDSDFLREIAMEGIYKKLCNLAMLQMFPFDLDFKTKKNIDELIKIGLIQSNRNDLKFSFMHDTLRDYFVAHLVSGWLEEKHSCSDWDIMTSILQDFLLKDRYKEIRIFLNCHLKNSIPSPNTLTSCRERLKKLFAENKSLVFNGEESFYHICVNENLDFLIKNFVIELIKGGNISSALLAKRNVEFKTPLFLLIEKIDMFDSNDENSTLNIFLKKINQLPSKCVKNIMLSTFFTYFATENQFSRIKQISEGYANIHKVLLEIQEPFSKIEDFLSACRRNKLKDVNKLLEAYNDNQSVTRYLVMVTNNKKQTGLHITISEKIISEMLKFGADLNLRDVNGLTPLIRAIKGGNTKIALTLIEKGADPDLSDTFKNSPLMHAIKHGNEEIVKVLLKFDQIDVTKYNRYGMTTLMQAARQGNKNIVSLLLDRRVPVNAVDQNGLSALFHCIKTKQIHLVNILKKYHADMDLPDLQGVTPLLDSIKKRNWSVVNTLLDNGARSFIHCAENDECIIKILVKENKDKLLKRIFNISKTTVQDINKYQKLSEIEKSYAIRVQTST
ncbi:hypothetical protein FQR65_LT13684 [Abscondita terminalis]|nr:hypothetical protein FQR65_LT13684 [Abscondita terminalis]